MKDIVPVITLYQPWATWVMRGWKTIETRTHNRFGCLQYKTILIHAGKTTDRSDAVTTNKYLTPQQMYESEETPNGVILGSVYVDDFRQLNQRHSKDSLIECESTRRFGLFLRDIKIFDEPIPERGSVGIWYFDMKNKVKIKKPSNQALLF